MQPLDTMRPVPKASLAGPASALNFERVGRQPGVTDVARAGLVRSADRVTRTVVVDYRVLIDTIAFAHASNDGRPASLPYPYSISDPWHGLSHQCGGRLC